MSVNLSDNFEKVLLAFNKHEVEYMIAGGYAVILLQECDMKKQTRKASSTNSLRNLRCVLFHWKI